MNPVVLRVLMVVAGITCLLVGHFVPSAEALIPVGTGLLGWAKAAPGHAVAVGQGSQAGFVRLRLLLGISVFAALLFACASLQKVDPRVAVRRGLQDTAKLCDAYKRGVGAGDFPDEPYIDQACSLLLAPTVAPAEAPSGAGGA